MKTETKPNTLEEAVDRAVQDVVESFQLAGATQEQVDTVNDAVTNNWEEIMAHFDGPTRKGAMEANAAFIVRACNSHYELLEACKEMQSLLENSDVRFKICDGGRGNLGEQSRYHRVMGLAAKAIRKTKEGK